MTLYDYLASLTVDGDSLVWSDKPLKDSQIAAADGNPYVRVAELGERPMTPMYGNQDVIMATVDVQMYQAPKANGTTPNRNDITRLYYDIYQAHQNVDEWVYGQRLISMHRDIAMPPRYDDETGGLMAMARFRLLFPRG